jgi:hypothetical protein
MSVYDDVPGSQFALWCGPNDGGIKRGDRADTGDEEAGPTDGVGPGGSGVHGGTGLGTVGTATVDPSSEGALDGAGAMDDVDADLEQGALHDADLGDLTVHDANDPTLGMTNIGDLPADDWAADTGPTHSAEEEDHVAADPLKSRRTPERPGKG